MKSWRTLPLLCTAFFLYCTTLAQSASPKTLLWRITGKDLSKPSYLFGTIHITNKQIFNLGDSVYRAIEGTEGLAIEINPDEMSAMLISMEVDKLTNVKKVKDILSDEEFKRYGKKLSGKFNKKAEEVTAADIVKEKNAWMTEYLAKGEMPTFLDAWLFTIGRKSGKWVGGIEDVADQTGLFQDMVDKSDIQYMVNTPEHDEHKSLSMGIDKLTKVYLDQDLDEIERYTNGNTSEEKRDLLLTRRNIKMARRMDSLAHIRSMFLAVGAAHLPGDSGVIALLRGRGFTVEPVFSSARIPQEQYKINEVELPWVNVADSSGLYEALMPNIPASIKLYGIVEMKFLLDISNMSAYCALAFPSAAGLHNSDSIYQALASKSLRTDNPGPYKSILQNGIPGREYSSIKPGANIRLRLYVTEKNIYTFFVYGMKSSAITSLQAEKYFNSLVLKSPIASENKYYDFVDSVAGLRLRSPAKLLYNEKMSSADNSGWRVATFTGMDLSTGSYIGVYVKSVTKGNYIKSDTLVFNEFRRTMAASFDGFSQRDTLFGGHRQAILTGRSKEQPSLLCQTAEMIINGRDIVVMLIADSLHFYKPSLQQVFRSLQIIPHPLRQWSRTAPDSACFSTVAPAPLTTYVTDFQNAHYFNAYDSLTANTYWVMTDTLDRFYQAESDSIYWSDRLKRWTGSDSLISARKITNGSMQGLEVLKRFATSVSRYKRSLLLLKDNVEYSVFADDDKSALYSGLTARFFDDFRFECPEKESGFPTRRKLPLILATLSGTDSAARVTAFSGLSDFDAQPADRILLEQNLFRHFLPVWGNYSVVPAINRNIASALAKIADSATISFVRSRYINADGDDTLKNIALTALAKMKTPESYLVMKELLLQSPPRRDIGFDFTGYLSDSLALRTTLFQVLQTFAGDSIQADDMAQSALALLDSNLISLAELRKYEPDYIKAARYWQGEMSSKERSEVWFSHVIDLLQRFNSPASNRMLHDLLRLRSTWLRELAAVHLLANKQDVPAIALQAIAADNSMRLQLYGDLKEKKRLDLFPKKYLTRAAFAEAAVYNAATDDEDYTVDTIQFLGTRTAKYKGKNYVFYLFKIQIEGDDVARLAVAGGYKPGGTGLLEDAAITGIDYQGDFNASKLEALLKNYIKRIEDQVDSGESDDE
ncbi:MAG: TraB/GumN family protein [Bacteroidota bacterium]|nr:TraB/GumN family protein [Bacteroidota bacterium]